MVLFLMLFEVRRIVCGDVPLKPKQSRVEISILLVINAQAMNVIVFPDTMVLQALMQNFYGVSGNNLNDAHRVSAHVLYYANFGADIVGNRTL